MRVGEARRKADPRGRSLCRRDLKLLPQERIRLGLGIGVRLHQLLDSRMHGNRDASCLEDALQRTRLVTLRSPICTGTILLITACINQATGAPDTAFTASWPDYNVLPRPMIPLQTDLIASAARPPSHFQYPEHQRAQSRTTCRVVSSLSQRHSKMQILAPFLIKPYNRHVHQFCL